MHRIFILMAFIVAGLAVGCTDAEFDKLTALGSKHRIELYSGGQMVRVWTSTGKVETETNSDGYYFRDAATGRLVRVTGDLVIAEE